VAHPPELICESVDGSHRYVVTGELPNGGQANVFTGVGKTHDGTGKVTLRVFRPVEPTPNELAQVAAEHHEQFRRLYAASASQSWTNGDTVLQMLNERGVPNICRWAASFVGHPPRPAGAPRDDDPVPVQALTFVEGENLQHRVSDQYRATYPDAPDVDGLHVLRGLADTLRAMDALDHVIHQDIKPANVIIRPDGAPVLIDFTSARKEADLTTIVRTPGASGPEVQFGPPTPAYDVHGFGAVAYHLLTQERPRRDGRLDFTSDIRHRPALEAHLRLLLDDDPDHRLRHRELHGWIDELAVLVRRTELACDGVRWNGPAVRDEPVTVPTPLHAEPAAFPFRALADLREAVSARALVGTAPGPALPVLALARTPGDWRVPSRPPGHDGSGPPRREEPWVGVWPDRPFGPPDPPEPLTIRRTPHTTPAPQRTAHTMPAPRRAPELGPTVRRGTDPVPELRAAQGPPSGPSLLRRATLGGELTAIFGGIAVLTWLVWLISGNAGDPVAAIASMLVFAGLAAVCVVVAQAAGARAARRWTTLHRSIAYYRLLHLPATLVFVAATVVYLWLI
jgi:hypothetical protein